MATLEQQRAEFALKKVDEVKDDKERRAKFKTQLLKLPARLHNNGLGQTVAFYLSAGKEKPGREKPEVIICGWLEEWLRKEIYPSGRLIENIAGQKLAPDVAEARYREASVEVRALAVWLKRFAEAFIEGEAEEK
jgi:CRISPR type III-B/RAMP module-associated protein Cmr5